MENPTSLAQKKIESHENKTLLKMQMMNISKLVSQKKLIIKKKKPNRNASTKNDFLLI